MKNLKTTTGILAIAFIALTVTSCKDNKKEDNHDDDANHTEMKMENNENMDHDNSNGHHNNDKMYACSMHPEITGKKGDKCSKCSMDLMEMKKDSKMSGDMAMAYACPMKCEGDKTYDKEGKCPKCNMNLKEMKTGDDHSEHKH